MIQSWIRKDFPYRPGAGRTGDRFGLRKDCIGSPFHTGDDRAALPRAIVMPFDGTMIWEHCGGDWGSILRLIPDDNTTTEIQVAHTECKDKKLEPLNYWIRQGEPLPVVSGGLGFGTGIHTHTEWLIRYTDENYKFFAKSGIWLRDKQSLNSAYIHEHCTRHGLDEASFITRFIAQCKTWGIIEANTTFCVRGSVPRYKTPAWGNGAVIIADPMLYLDI